jgi:hypothetical protein
VPVGRAVRAGRVLQDKLCYYREHLSGQGVSVSSLLLLLLLLLCIVVMTTDLSDHWHDGMGLKDLCMCMYHAYLDRGSLHVCHGVSAARIGFQHKAVQREAPRTLRMAIV